MMDSMEEKLQRSLEVEDINTQQDLELNSIKIYRMDNLNFQDIYAKLLDGKRLTLLFPSAESAESFRVKMSKYKTAQEELCAIVDIRVGSEGKVFSFKMIKNVNPVAEVHYKTSFEDKPKETYYEVIEIESPAKV